MGSVAIVRGFLLSFPILILVAGASVAQTAASSGSDRLQSGTCGPPEYCARTDRRVELYPDNHRRPVHLKSLCAGCVLVSRTRALRDRV
jgi:hypothetical protein